MGILRKKRGWIRGGGRSRRGVGIGRAATRVYMLDAAESSYSSPGGKTDVRGRIGYDVRSYRVGNRYQ